MLQNKVVHLFFFSHISIFVNFDPLNPFLGFIFGFYCSVLCKLSSKLEKVPFLALFRGPGGPPGGGSEFFIGCHTFIIMYLEASKRKMIFFKYFISVYYWFHVGTPYPTYHFWQFSGALGAPPRRFQKI